MEDLLKQGNSEQSFRSLAIYGLGGVGKSTVALKYARAKFELAELDAVFWVYSETSNSIKQSFTDIALRLRLPGVDTGNHDENRLLVLYWLQQTKCRWLLIYDNAETLELIRTHWPVAACGQAIITTRNVSFAYAIADSGLELATWDADTGARFLLHLLSDQPKDETFLARELSSKLGGHALAISHTAGLIHQRALTIEEFLNMYDKRPTLMHRKQGDNPFSTLWDISFSSLSLQSHNILGVLCFLASDHIPQSLFELELAVDLPENLQFCADDFEFADAVHELLNLTLIKRDRESRALSVHRLVQMSFRYFMTPDQREGSFNNAVSLVSKAFPRRGPDVAQSYLVWSQCSMYVPHVLSLKDAFRQARKSNPKFTGTQVYCDLNNQCQQHLLEVNQCGALEDLIGVTEMALSTLPEEQQTPGLQCPLLSQSGQLLIRLGKPAEGVSRLRQSYDIQSHEQPSNFRDLAWAAGDVANGMGTLNEFPEAIRWHERARHHWFCGPNDQTSERGHWPAYMERNLAVALVWSGLLDQAREIATSALHQIESTDPYDWVVAAYTRFTLGTISFKERNFETAQDHLEHAAHLWMKKGDLQTHPFNAACMYRLAGTELIQGNYERAIDHLRQASTIISMQEPALIAERARCLFGLSKALHRQQGDQHPLPEVLKFRHEAELLLRSRDPNVEDLHLESTYDSLVNILWR
ncbi:Tetratricopeptide-like helical [Cucurbitaria berberidis CBS 394.84]|uniref:Tetratricopeptide-like helical n=1 Tax=Cucurbitaria berberidis CBS 394.84 TaxID=1168544 RepID=A0A9P4L882_9PLEO|nr:Tetratricopeptide-like helical [Cucurbitaria berberidis CBS 394.84]KAF1844988.1 Tetratricopeptide-like helical [Cucurbitaria berberidis CBS 394.84]